MSSLLRGWGLLAGLLASLAFGAEQKAPPATAAPAPLTDLHGDPLPKHACARLGTVRFRHAGDVHHLRYLPDGKTLISCSGSGTATTLHAWEAGTGRPLYQFPRPDDPFQVPELGALAPDGRLAAGFNWTDRRFGIWELATARQVLAVGEPIKGDLLEWVVRFSPDGKALAVAARRSGRDSPSKLVHLYDVGTGHQTGVLDFDDPKGKDGDGRFEPRALVFAPDGSRLALHARDLTGNEGTTRVWDRTTGKLLVALSGLKKTIGAPCFFPDGKVFATAWRMGPPQGAKVTAKVALLDAATGKGLHELAIELQAGNSQGQDDPKPQLVPSADGRVLAIADRRSAMVRLYDAATGKELPAPSSNGGRVSVAFAPDGRTLAVFSHLSGEDRRPLLMLWDVAAAKELRPLESLPAATLWDTSVDKRPPADIGAPVAFTPDGKTLAAIVSGKVSPWYPCDVRLWELATGKERTPVPAGPRGVINALAVSADSSRVLAAYEDGTARLWDTTTSQELRCFGKPAEGQYTTRSHVALAADGRTATLVTDEGLQLWDLAANKKLHTFPWPNNDDDEKYIAFFAAFAPLGERLAVLGHDGVFWADRATAPKFHRLDDPKDKASFKSARFGPDGRTLTLFASGTEECRLDVYELPSGLRRRTITLDAVGGVSAPPARLRSAKPSMEPLALSPDGRMLACCIGTSVALWDLASGKELRQLDGNGRGVGDIVFTPDGKLAIGALGDGIRLWDVATGTPVGWLAARSGSVRFLALSADGRTLVSAGGNDRTVLVWDLAAALKGVSAPPVPKLAPLPAPAKLPTADRHGEPLPAHARDRLGNGIFSHSSPALGLRFLPDGKTVVSESWDRWSPWGRVLRFVETNTGRHLRRFYLPSGAQLSPDGRLVASGDSPGRPKLWDVATGLEAAQLPFDMSCNHSTTFSPDNKVLAITFGHDSKADADKIRLLDVATGKELVKLDSPPPENGEDWFYLDSQHLAFSADAKVLAARYYRSSGEERLTRVWNVSTGKVMASVPDNCKVNPPLLTPDGKLLVGAEWPEDGKPNKIVVWETATGKPLHELKGPKCVWPEPLLLAADGRTVALYDYSDHRVCLWETATGKALPALALKAGEGKVVLTLAPDGRTLALVSTAGIRLWDVAAGKELPALAGYRGPGKPRRYDPNAPAVPAVAFSPDGKTLAAMPFGAVQLWDVATGKEIPRAAGAPLGAVEHFAVSADGTRVLAAYADRTVRLWDAAAGKELRCFTRPADTTAGAIGIVALSPDGRFAAAAWADRGVRLWDLTADNEPLYLPSIDGSRIGSLVFSPDGKTLAGIDRKCRALWWDVATGRRTDKANPVDGRPYWRSRDEALMAFAPDAKTLVSLSPRAGSCEARFWQPTDGTLRRHITLHLRGDHAIYHPVVALALSPDGRTVALRDGAVCLWDLENNRELRQLGALTETVHAVAFSPDGKLAAGAIDDGSIRLWETATGTLLARLEGHLGAAHAVAFTADGRTLVSGADDGGLLFWDVASALRKSAAPTPPALRSP